MTLWMPDPAKLRRPAYLSLAEEIGRAIGDGRLATGERLPTHRQLAEQLGLSVQTVSRAYDELVRRGLVSGEIGRGTFVRSLRREPDPPYLPERIGELVDLSILKPICEPLHLTRMQEALGLLAQTLPPSAALSFRPNVVFPRHRVVAAEWLRRCGVDVAPENITIANGATPAITVALMSAASAGSTIATEAISHHTVVPLASYLGLKLKGVAVDEEGMLPDALERACRETAIRGVFLQPSVINPRAALMSAERRAALAAVAERHDLTIIENDILGPLIDDGPAPIAALAPQRTLYVTGFSKITVPGLRVGYLVAPEKLSAVVANRHLVTNWMATPIMVEIASRWVSDGTALELVDWQRDALRRRHAIAADMLEGISFRSHASSLHIWLDLPEAVAEESFVAQARIHGVAIAPSASFRTRAQDHESAVRISLGSTTENELRAGLRIIHRLLQGDPDLLPLPI